MGFMKKNKLLIILIIGIYVSILLLNVYSAMAPDEYNYSHIYNTDQKIKSFSDIGISMKELYMTWTGRIPVHAMISLFLYVGIPFYNALNPAIFILFLIFIIKNATKDFKMIYLPILFALLLYGTNAFGEDFIWLSGSLNYLWTSCAMLIYIYYLYNYILEDKKINSTGLVAITILGFLVGFSQEVIAFITGASIIVLVFANIKKIFKFTNRKKIIIISMIIAFGIGAMFLIFAPGNFCRLETSGRKLEILNILKRFYWIKELIIFYIITLITNIFIDKKNKNYSKDNPYKKGFLKQFIYYFLPIIIALIPMLIISEFTDRVMLPYVSYILVAVIFNLNYIFKYLKTIKYEKIIVTSITILFVIICLIKIVPSIYFSYKYIEPIKQKNIEQLKIAKEKGQKEVVVSKFIDNNKVVDSKITVFFFPSVISKDIINYYMAKYYEVEKIQAVEDNNCIIEITLSEESTVAPYDIIDKNTKEKIGERILNTPYPRGNDIVNKEIIFVIPRDKVGEYLVYLPENIKNKITKCVVKNIDEIKNVSIDEIVY